MAILHMEMSRTSKTLQHLTHFTIKYPNEFWSFKFFDNKEKSRICDERDYKDQNGLSSSGVIKRLNCDPHVRILILVCDQMIQGLTTPKHISIKNTLEETKRSTFAFCSCLIFYTKPESFSLLQCLFLVNTQISSDHFKI